MRSTPIALHSPPTNSSNSSFRILSGPDSSRRACWVRFSRGLSAVGLRSQEESETLHRLMRVWTRGHSPEPKHSLAFGLRPASVRRLRRRSPLRRPRSDPLLGSPTRWTAGFLADAPSADSFLMYGSRHPPRRGPRPRRLGRTPPRARGQRSRLRWLISGQQLASTQFAVGLSA